jgi:hypothetical protein
MSLRVLVTLAIAAFLFAHPCAADATSVRSPTNADPVGLGAVLDRPAIRESVGVDVAGAGDSLECKVAPRCPHVWLGERPRFAVRIKNRSSRPVFLVAPLDGSLRGRFPRVRFAYDGPPGGVRPLALLDCGNQNNMEPGDFVLVPPGKSIELRGNVGLEDPAVSFGQPGRYLARFEYSTLQNDLRSWLGDFQPESLPEEWRARFRRVPRVDLHAECTFEVQQR